MNSGAWQAWRSCHTEQDRFHSAARLTRQLTPLPETTFNVPSARGIEHRQLPNVPTFPSSRACGLALAPPREHDSAPPTTLRNLPL